MHVEQHEGAACGDLVQARGQLLVELLPLAEGDLSDRRVEGVRLPDLHAPGLLRPRVDRIGRAAVEVDLETGTMHHHPVGDACAQLVGERVLLAEPVVFGQHHRLRHLGPQVVTSVDRGGDHWPLPAAVEGPCCAQVHASHGIGAAHGGTGQWTIPCDPTHDHGPGSAA